MSTSASESQIPVRSSVNFFSPSLLSKTLEKIVHRFIIILECEGRISKESGEANPPRFSVGGKRASADPRTQPISQLIDIVENPNEITIPQEWEKLHPFMYVMGHHTDDHGWHYRSAWHGSASETSHDEPWTPLASSQQKVRRRMWICTVVKKDELISAKTCIYKALSSLPNDNIVMEGVVSVFETSNNNFVKKIIRLRSSILEVCRMGPNGEFLGVEANLALDNAYVRMVFNSKNKKDHFMFFIRKFSPSHEDKISNKNIEYYNNRNCIIFSVPNPEIRRCWTVSISYQVLLNTPDANFPPLEYGPPLNIDKDMNEKNYHTYLGFINSDQTLYYGPLSKKSHSFLNSHKLAMYQLCPRDIRYYNKATNHAGKTVYEFKGSIPLDITTTLKSDSSTEFTIKNKSSGSNRTLMADTPEICAKWFAAIDRQLGIIYSGVDLVLLNESELSSCENPPPAAPIHLPPSIIESRDIVLDNVGASVKVGGNDSGTDDNNNDNDIKDNEASSSPVESHQNVEVLVDSTGPLQPESSEHSAVDDSKNGGSNEVIADEDSSSEVAAQASATSVTNSNSSDDNSCAVEKNGKEEGEAADISADSASSGFNNNYVDPLVSYISTHESKEQSAENKNHPNLKFGGGFLPQGDPKDTATFKYAHYTKFPEFSSEHLSLLPSCLTPDLFLQLQAQGNCAFEEENNSNVYTLSNAIMCGVLSPQLSIGITAGNEFSYRKFMPLMDPIIRKINNLSADKSINASELTQEYKQSLDAVESHVNSTTTNSANNYIQRIRIKSIRNLVGLPFPAGATETDLSDISAAWGTILNLHSSNSTSANNNKKLSSNGSVESGVYYALDALGDIDLDFLRDKQLLIEYDNNDVFSLGNSSGAGRLWPKYRGVYVTTSEKNDNTSAVVNEEDQASFVSWVQREGGSDQASEGLNDVAFFSQSCSDHLAFMRDLDSAIAAAGHRIMQTPELGLLTSCPSNLGSGLSISIFLSLPESMYAKGILHKIVDEHNLSIDKISFSSDASSVSVILSNSIKFGVSVDDAVRNINIAVNKFNSADVSEPFANASLKCETSTNSADETSGSTSSPVPSSAENSAEDPLSPNSQKPEKRKSAVLARYALADKAETNKIQPVPVPRVGAVGSYLSPKPASTGGDTLNSPSMPSPSSTSAHLYSSSATKVAPGRFAPVQTSYLNKSGGGAGAGGGSAARPLSYQTPTKSNAFPNPKSEEEDDDDFGMAEVSLTPTVEARMSKKLVEQTKERRSSFVLSQIAKHETYFEQAGIDKNSPTLGNKAGHKFINR